MLTKNKVLRFPDKVSLGTLIINYPKDSPKYSRDDEQIIDAQGEVQVPPDQQVTLQLTREGLASMDSLRELPPDGLFAVRYPPMKIFEEHTKPLIHLSGLRCLDSMGAPQDSALGPLAELPNLEELNLSPSYGITDKGAKIIAKMRTLKSLSLSHTVITDQALFDLKDLPLLETLALQRCDITDAGLAHLKDLPKLKKLDLSQTKITDQGLVHLKDKAGLVIDTSQSRVSAKFSASAMEIGTMMPSETVCEDLLVSHREFSFRFLTALIARQQQQEKNIVVSPMSVFMALQLVGEATSGENFNEMARLLNLKWGDVGQVRTASLALKRNIERVSQAISLVVANSLWFDPQVDADAVFQACCREFYEADVLPLESKEQVDQWCSQRTRGLIPLLPVEQIKDALILNVVYFKGLWHDEFDVKDTIDKNFSASNKVVRCPFMTKRESFNYCENRSLQMIELPYKGKRFSFYAVKPLGQDVWQLTESLTARVWSSLTNSMRNAFGYLAMPRFKYTNRLDLHNPLNSLGFSLIYSQPPGIIDKLKRSGMNLAVDQVIQQALIEVNEKGTEAAALTAVSVETGCADPPKPFEMILDSPFLYVIADKVLNIPIFMGIVVNPQDD